MRLLFKEAAAFPFRGQQQRHVESEGILRRIRVLVHAIAESTVPMTNQHSGRTALHRQCFRASSFLSEQTQGHRLHCTTSRALPLFGIDGSLSSRDTNRLSFSIDG